MERQGRLWNVGYGFAVVLWVTNEDGRGWVPIAWLARSRPGGPGRSVAEPGSHKPAHVRDMAAGDDRSEGDRQVQGVDRAAGGGRGEDGGDEAAGSRHHHESELILWMIWLF